MRAAFHVDYVTEPGDSEDPIGFLLEALGQPGSLVLLLVGAAIALAVLVAWARWRPLEAARIRLVERAGTYREFVPWMIRLSVGLVLIGSGLARTLFVPTHEAGGLPALLLTGCGFLLLLGLFVRPAALVALATYAVAFVTHPDLVMMLDVPGALAAALILGPGRPSADDLLHAAFPGAPTERIATARMGGYADVVPLAVRIGLGGAFAASGIVDKLFIYDQALAAVDQYGLTSVVPVPAELWVLGAILIETGLGLAILLGVMTRLSAIIGFTVLTLALFALPDDPVISHVGLFGLSSVLVVLGAGRWSLDHLVLGRLGDRLKTA